MHDMHCRLPRSSFVNVLALLLCPPCVPLSGQKMNRMKAQHYMTPSAACGCRASLLRPRNVLSSSSQILVLPWCLHTIHKNHQDLIVHYLHAYAESMVHWQLCQTGWLDSQVQRLPPVGHHLPAYPNPAGCGHAGSCSLRAKAAADHTQVWGSSSGAGVVQGK